MSLIHSILENKTEIKSEYLNDVMYNLLDTTFKMPIDGFQFNIFEVSNEYIARPDLISLDAYGTSDYTDVICKLNGISNPFELNTGMELIIPIADHIQLFTVIPNNDEIESISDVPHPTQKTNLKRKANESLVGDTRFRIDAASGVIIY
ncbi:MAG: hypothetical protein IKU29_02270 [Parabacteroides sp.]|nr:hypothetical protein [Parabacteroides sp.]